MEDLKQYDVDAAWRPVDVSGDDMSYGSKYLIINDEGIVHEATLSYFVDADSAGAQYYFETVEGDIPVRDVVLYATMGSPVVGCAICNDTGTVVNQYVEQVCCGMGTSNGCCGEPVQGELEEHEDICSDCKPTCIVCSSEISSFDGVNLVDGKHHCFVCYFSETS